jgi:tetrahydromethanopterin S-methyltransferase subunit F
MDKLDMEVLLSKISELEQENAALKNKLFQKVQKPHITYDTFLENVKNTFDLIYKKSDLLFGILFYGIIILIIGILAYSISHREITDHYYISSCNSNGVQVKKEIIWGVDDTVTPCISDGTDTSSNYERASLILSQEKNRVSCKCLENNLK